MTVSAKTNGNVLVVDDDEESGVLLRDMLRRRGFKVDAVSSGRKALTHLYATPVDVVVTDFQMPDMTGIELCVELGKRFSDLLSIVITGRSGSEVADAARGAGAYDFIVKPVEPNALARSIVRAIEHLSLRRDQRRAATDGGEDCDA